MDCRWGQATLSIWSLTGSRKGNRLVYQAVGIDLVVVVRSSTVTFGDLLEVLFVQAVVAALLLVKGGLAKVRGASNRGVVRDGDSELLVHFSQF